MQDYRKLQVWEKAHRFVLTLYENTRSFPRDEQFGLTRQMRRAAVSIPSNLAEGCGRGSIAELAYFCDVAMGSASEVEYQLTLAFDLRYLNEANHRKMAEQLSEIKKMLMH